jgi:APA family basic amino acid/polyamine antiporter
MGALNGWILLHGELPRSMAVRGLFPSFFGRVTGRATPYASLLLGSVLTTLLLLANSSKGTAALFAFMALLSTSCSLWIYLACSIAAIRLRAAMITSALGIAFGIWALWGAGVQASGLSFALMIAGAPLYWIARREAGSAPLGREPASIA